MPLVVEGAVVVYGSQPALAGVDLTVGDREVVALLGANGAGKSTLLRAVSGLVPLAAGSVAYDGRRLAGLRPGAVVRAGIVQVPERRRIFHGLTVLDNLRAGAFTRGRRRDEDVEWVMGVFPDLRAQAFRPAGALPVGSQQVLALARALVARPRLLLVDELSTGISPALAVQLFSVLRSLSLNGVSVLVAEQFVNLALDLADRVYVIENGRITVEAEPARLSLSDVPWQSTHPGGGDASASRSKGAPN